MVIKKKVETEKTTQKFPIKCNGTVKINEKKLINDFVCAKCLKTIGKNQRFVLLGTYELNKKSGANLDVGLVDEHYYHISCWVDYFNQRVIERLTRTQSQAIDFLQNNPVFDNLIKNTNLLRV
jgi:hypothetical protein